MKVCELCTVDEVTTETEYQNVYYRVCGRCRALAELEDEEDC